MNTKLSVALLSGLSLFMSIGAFAVSGEEDDYINWSYAMGETPAKPTNDIVVQNNSVNTTAQTDPTKCTVGCPSRPNDESISSAESLTLTYEDEAAPVVERVETFTTNDRYDTGVSTPTYPVSARDPIASSPVSQPTANMQFTGRPQPIFNPQPQVDTHYVQSMPKVQYPITRQYPISVQYPVTVQRNMTVEQPVIMQQPVIVRRPVVMQQDITVQRQPTVIQHQPVVMQQQPTYVQQQPVFVQAPAGQISPNILSGFNAYPTQQQPDFMMVAPPVMPQQPLQQAETSVQNPTQQAQGVQNQVPQASQNQVAQPPVMMQPAQIPYMQMSPMLGQPQQYQVQGQIQAQPMYGQQMTLQQMAMPAPQPAQSQMFLTPTY